MPVNTEPKANETFPDAHCPPAIGWGNSDVPQVATRDFF